MQIGDLSRKRTLANPLGSAVIRALSVVLALVFAIAGWQLWPSSSAEQASAQQEPLIVGEQQGAAQEPQRPLPEQAEQGHPVQVAAAGAAGLDGGAAYSAPPAQPKADPAASSNAGSPVASPVPPVASAGEIPQSAPVAEQTGTNPPPPVAPPTSDVTGAVRADLDTTAKLEEGSGLIDLNTASVAELNGLRGGGPIGRAIIRGRPYASVEDLVKKRVLKRSTYELVKDQVTAR